MSEFDRKNKVEQIASDVSSYVSMRIDSAKLDAVEGLARLTSTIAGVLIAGVLVFMAMVMFVGVFTYWLGTVIGSVELAVVIVGSFILILAVIIFLFKENLFGNSMVKLFAEIIFRRQNEGDNNEQEK